MTRHLLALLILVIFGSASAAADTKATASARASVRLVSPEVVPFAESQPINVTSADLLRGYVELSDIRGANPTLDHRFEVLTDGQATAAALWNASPDGLGRGALRFRVSPEMTRDHEINVELRLVIN